MSKLNTDQERKIAKLLLHFSSCTNSEILGRFDRSTRNRIRQAMSELGETSEGESNESLHDFAEFLYFEPQAPESDRSTLPVPATAAISFVDVVQLPIEDLDKLLQTAPVDLTLKTLCCSPKSFVHRVIGRLSDEDAQLVRQRLNATDSIDYSEMQATHRKFCRVVDQLIQQGQIAARQRN